MATEEDLRSIIESSRKASEDGSIVTYDLTKGMNFSNPRKAAEALVSVFFEKDAVNWFSVSDDHVEFNPTYKVRIVLAENHNRKLENTVDDFLEDLKKKEIHPKFSKQLSDAAEHSSRLQATMAGNALQALLMKHYDKKFDNDYFQDDLLLDLLEKLEIRSLNDEDLMDWKNLPI